MCGLYYQISACLPYQLCMTDCPFFYPCITFPFTHIPFGVWLVVVQRRTASQNQTFPLTQVYLLFQGLLYHSRVELLTRNTYVQYLQCGYLSIIMHVQLFVHVLHTVQNVFCIIILQVAHMDVILCQWDTVFLPMCNYHTMQYNLPQRQQAFP